MKSKLIYGIIVILLLFAFAGCIGSCGGSSQYEQDLDNGLNKFSQGDYDDMTDGEKEAVGNFLDWQSEQQE